MAIPGQRSSLGGRPAGTPLVCSSGALNDDERMPEERQAVTPLGSFETVL